MARDNNIVSFSGQKSPQRFSLPQALVRLRDASGQSLKRVLANFFDRSDDALFELADRASNTRDQAAYFDAMRELRLRRKAMVVSMLQYVSQAFNDIGRFRPRDSSGILDEVEDDSQSLVDHSQLEQQVAIENLINKLRTRYSDQIQLLTARVNHVVPSIELANSQMPLSPEVLCSGVAEACADLDIDIRAKLVVLKLFDRLLADTLGAFYREANQTLISEGVLPDMKRPPDEQSGGSKSPAGSGGTGSAAKSPGSGSGGEGAQATFSELSALLHQGGEGNGSDRAATGEGHLDTDRLMARLSEVQAAAGQWGVDEIITLNDQLKPVLTVEQGRFADVGQVDNDVINLVGMLFDFILEDRQLHPVMKSLISRLQIPVLKVALSDKNFFNRGGHPVRKLLNELALSAIGWSEKRSGQRDPLRDKIESVVERILNEFTDNVELFEELLADFSHFMDLDRRRRELVEQRLRDAEEGHARQERASEMVDAMIRDLAINRNIPAPVDQLLQDAWRKYLQWLVLREGEDSQKWADVSDLTERLVWSVDPQPVSDTTRSDLLRAIPSIVDDLRRALQEISWDPFATDSIIRDLELAHVDVFQRLVTAPARSEPPVEASDGVDAPDEPETTRSLAGAADAAETGANVTRADTVQPEESSDPNANAVAPEVAETGTAPAGAVAQEWLDRADALRVGSWTEMSKDGGKVRCKLAAFIKATGKYIFVNRSGAKVAEYHRQDLAFAMASGEIGMLDDGLIFDRALESIIDNLRSSRKD